MYTIRKDKYHKSRGGTSRVLDVTCDHCNEHVTYYQKDGPGMLKRMYFDRFIDITPYDNTLACISCGRESGIAIIYEKEARKAYRLFAGAVNKKIVNRNILK